MKKLRFSGKIGDKNAYLCRIDKRKARALFELGRTIYLVPSNLVPFGHWIQPVAIKKSNDAVYTFDQFVNSFTYYSCVSNETGYFPAYYIDLNSNEPLNPVKL